MTPTGRFPVLLTALGEPVPHLALANTFSRCAGPLRAPTTACLVSNPRRKATCNIPTPRRSRDFLLLCLLVPGARAPLFLCFFGLSSRRLKALLCDLVCYDGHACACWRACHRAGASHERLVGARVRRCCFGCSQSSSRVCAGSRNSQWKDYASPLLFSGDWPTGVCHAYC